MNGKYRPVRIQPQSNKPVISVRAVRMENRPVTEAQREATTMVVSKIGTPSTKMGTNQDEA